MLSWSQLGQDPQDVGLIPHGGEAQLAMALLKARPATADPLHTLLENAGWHTNLFFFLQCGPLLVCALDMVQGEWFTKNGSLYYSQSTQ
jgi:hypothetical protein